MNNLSEWIKRLSQATFDMGIDFPMDSFEEEVSMKVQARLLELYFVPQSWLVSVENLGI